MLKAVVPSGALIAASQAPATPSLVVKLAASAIPLIMAPTGTMANNGAITLGTALDNTYGSCFLFLPAAAISAGSLAGWYYAQMSSTTAATVFNNTYSAGIPAIPPAPTPFVTTGPGAYTGATGAVNGIQYTLPANSMGPNGKLRIGFFQSNNNSAGAKIIPITFGGQSLTVLQNTTSITLWHLFELGNRGATNSQVTLPSLATGPGASSGAPQFFAVDTTVNQIIGINFNDNTATDFSVLQYFSIELLPG